MSGKVLSSPGRRKKENDERILRRTQRIWRLVYIEGYDYVNAWRKASPVSKAKKRNWGRLAKKDCKLFVEKNGKDLQALLDAAGLGLSRVVQELDKSLNVKKIELYQGKIVVDKKGLIIHFDDNAIQQRGRELLVDVHGLKKQKIEIENKLDEWIEAFENIK